MISKTLPVSIGVLAHYEAVEAKPKTHVPWEVAEQLLSRLVCERITRKVIRMMPPESVCQTLKPDAKSVRYIPEKLPPLNVPNTFFQRPAPLPWAYQQKCVAFYRSM